MVANQLSNTLLLTDIPQLATRFQALVPDTLKVYVATTTDAAIHTLNTTDIEVIISCPQFAKNSGFEFFDQLTLDYPDPIRIMITDVDEVQAAVSAIQKGSIYKYLVKPLNKRQVLKLVAESSELYRIRTNIDKKALTYDTQLTKAERNIHDLISDIKSSADLSSTEKFDYITRLKTTLEILNP